MTLLKELKENNPNYFKNYLRMSDEVFQEIHANTIKCVASLNF